MLVTDENNQLRRRLAELVESAKPELRQVGAVNYYFVGETGPFCQKCYDGKGKLTMLTPQEDWNGGKRRSCVLCGFYLRLTEGWLLRARYC